MAGGCSYAVSALQYDIMIIACHHITYCALVEKGEGPYMIRGAPLYLSLSLCWVGEVEVCGGCMCVLCMCCVTPIAS